MSPFTGEQEYLASWRRVLEERAEKAIAKFAQVQGVLGLILCGSIGRGEPWPLSDIDMIVIYEDEQLETAASAVETQRTCLLDLWTAEGHTTSLDIGKLAFTHSEVLGALAFPVWEATRYLADPRWFHGIDKGYRGRAVFDPEKIAHALSLWFTKARFTPEVVGDRLKAHQRAVREHYEEALVEVGEGNNLKAAVALRESLHALCRYLMESWGGQDSSWARFGTRFERKAAEHNQADLAAEIMTLYGLSPEDVEHRMAAAPEGIRQRHKLSLAARQLVGEEVSASQDARDVLLVFAAQEVRYRPPPYGEWVGLQSAPHILAASLEEYDKLLRTFRLGEANHY